MAACVVLLALSAMTSVSAQVREGAVELGFDLGPCLMQFRGSDGGDGGLGFFAGAHLGYALSDRLAIGANGLFYLSVPNGSWEAGFGGAYTYVNYTLSLGSRFSPYVGGRIGLGNFGSHASIDTLNPSVLPSADRSQLVVGAQAGIQYFVARQVSITGELVLPVSPGSDGVIYAPSLGVGVSYHYRSADTTENTAESPSASRDRRTVSIYAGIGVLELLSFGVRYQISGAFALGVKADVALVAGGEWGFQGGLGGGIKGSYSFSPTGEGVFLSVNTLNVEVAYVTRPWDEWGEEELGATLFEATIGHESIEGQGIGFWWAVGICRGGSPGERDRPLFFPGAKCGLHLDL